jgi:hypothetical protein
VIYDGKDSLHLDTPCPSSGHQQSAESRRAYRKLNIRFILTSSP